MDVIIPQLPGQNGNTFTSIRASAMSKKIPSPFEVAWTFAKYRIALPLRKKPFLPKLLVLLVTNRCNAQCVMCGIWENQALYPQSSELTLEQYDQVLSDRLFGDIESININGGELSLRSDLPQIIQVAVKRLPKLRAVGMTSNGILTERLVRQVKQVKQICDDHKIPFSVTISLHGLAETDDKVFGIPGVFEKQIKTLDALQAMAKESYFHIGLACVINKENIDNLPALQDWAKKRNLEIGFMLVEMRERFNNLEKGDQFQLPEGDKAKIAGFLRQLSRAKSIFNPYAYVYDYMADLLQYNAVRKISCEYSLGGVILGAQGELYYCPHSDDIGSSKERPAYDIFYDPKNLEYRDSALIHRQCLHCPPRHIGRLDMRADIFKYLKFVLFPKREKRSQE